MKIAWMLALIFLSWVELLAYTAYMASQFIKKTTVPSLQRPNNPIYEESYSPYEQGYHPVQQKSFKPFITDVVEPENRISPLYDQVQIMYPEDPR
jgi:hypothetical protein